MRNILLSIAVVAAATALNAQTLSTFKDKILYEQDPNGSSAQILINEDASARVALTELERRTPKSTVSGYRIGLFFDNSSSARSAAMDVVALCDSLYNDIPTTMSYDNPYFKVSAGYCTNAEEAVIMLNRLQRHFPKAYLMREQISVENVIAARDKELEKERNEQLKLELEALERENRMYDTPDTDNPNLQ